MSRRNTVISDLTYTFDGAGRKAKETNVVTNASIQYTYDKAGRLTSVKDVSGTVTYAYDSNGNLISKTDALGTTSYVYNKANQLLNMTTPTGKVTTYTYDANGNLIKETNGTSTTTYSYNYEGKLIKEVQPDGSVITYGYDGEGRRISKTVKGVTTRFYYDGNQIAKEVSASGTTLAEYLYGFGGSPIAMIRDGHTYSYIYNGHGDTIALVNETQFLSMTYRYDPFGKVTATGFIVNPFLYGGQYGVYHDSETGLDFMQIRYYNSALGRFITPDTFPGLLENPISQNAYLYANGDPINNVDPDGHSAWSWGKVWNSVKSVARTVVNKVTSVVKSAVSWVKSTWSSAKSWVKQTWSKAKSTVKKTYQTARSTAQTAWKQSVDYAKQRAEEMKRAAERAAEEARQRWENTKRMLTQMKEESKKITQSIIDQATKAAKEEVQAAKETAKAKMMSMAQAASQAANKFLASSTGQVVKDLGKIVIRGLEVWVAVTNPVDLIMGGKLLKDGLQNLKEGLDSKTGKVVMSTLQTVGGAVEFGIGAAMAVGAGWTGIGAVAGVALMAYGANNMIDGGTSLYNMATNQGDTGLNILRDYVYKPVFGEKAGSIIYNVTDIALGFVGGGVGQAKNLGRAGKVLEVIGDLAGEARGAANVAKELVSNQIESVSIGLKMMKENILTQKESVINGFNSMVEGVKNYQIPQLQLGLVPAEGTVDEARTIGQIFTDFRDTFSRYVLNSADEAKNASKIPTEGSSEVKSVSKDYKKTFFEQNSELEGKVVVHHGIEQQVLKRPETKGLFSEDEIHDYENLRGIPKEINSDLHLSQIRKEWNRFYKENPNPTKDQLLQKRKELDDKFGHLFNPPIK